MEDKAIPEAVFQVGVVVRSVDETLKKLKDCFEIDTDSIQIKTTKDMAEQGVLRPTTASPPSSISKRPA